MKCKRVQEHTTPETALENKVKDSEHKAQERSNSIDPTTKTKAMPKTMEESTKYAEKNFKAFHRT